MTRKLCLLACLIAFSATFTSAQDKDKKPAEGQAVTAPVANPADVASRDAIMAAAPELTEVPAEYIRRGLLTDANKYVKSSLHSWCHISTNYTS